MSEGRSKGKRLIPLPERLLKGLLAASSKEGKTVNAYIEEALQQAVITPLNVFDFMTNKVYATDKEKLLKVWFESGEWYGKYISEKFDKPVQALANLLKVARWDLNEVNVKDVGDRTNLRCTSTSLTKEGTELLIKFIEGALSGMNCEIVKNDFMKGLIVVEFKLCT
jgi:hypothetical protein